MKVLFLPSRLRATIALLMLTMPIAAIEVAISAKAPWWRLPQQTMLTGALLAAVLCVPSSFAAYRARKWGLYYYGSVSALWIMASGFVAARDRNPALGFYTLFLLSYSAGLLIALRNEMCRSFLDPQLRWFQSIPRPIPGVGCEVRGNSKLKVSRIDSDGAFVFSDSVSQDAWLDFSKETGPLEVAFNFRDQSITCEAVPASLLSRGPGAGLRFSGLSPDQRKELGDFVELLRGEGYVS